MWRIFGALSLSLVVTATSAAVANARQMVPFSSGYSPGTVVVKTHERRLYYVVGYGQALRYPVGVGKAGKTWAGSASIAGKYIRPAWSPPAEIRRDKPGIPDLIPSGSRRVHSPYKDEASCQAALKKIEAEMKRKFPDQFPLVGSCEHYEGDK